MSTAVSTLLGTLAPAPYWMFGFRVRKHSSNLAMLELFYSTGMRLSELQGLNRSDLDLVGQQVKVRGKGRKERIIPVGNHAMLALRNYEAKRDDLLSIANNLFNVVSSGKVKVPVNQKYALKDIQKAHRDLESRATTGSTILIP